MAKVLTMIALIPAYVASQSTSVVVKRHRATSEVAITRSWVGASVVNSST